MWQWASVNVQVQNILQIVTLCLLAQQILSARPIKHPTLVLSGSVYMCVFM